MALGVARFRLDSRQFEDPSRTHTGYALYDKNRFFTFSGNMLPSSGDIRDLTVELVALHRELFPAANTSTNGVHKGVEERAEAVFSLDDSELLDRARRAKNGYKFSRL